MVEVSCRMEILLPLYAKEYIEEMARYHELTFEEMVGRILVEWAQSDMRHDER